MTPMPDLNLAPQTLSEKVSNASGAVLWIILSLLLRGWLISWGWNHFITFGLHAAPISIPIALGLSSILTVAITNYSDLHSEEASKTSIIEKMVKMVLFYLFTLLIMWIIWQFA